MTTESESSRSDRIDVRQSPSALKRRAPACLQKWGTKKAVSSHRKQRTKKAASPCRKWGTKKCGMAQLSRISLNGG